MKTAMKGARLAAKSSGAKGLKSRQFSVKESGDKELAASSMRKATKVARHGSIDPALVRQIADLLNGTDLTEIEVQKGDLRIRVARAVPGMVSVARSPGVGPAAVVAAPPVEAPVSEHPGTIKSPMVGTAYLRPSPEARAFVEIGSSVKAGEKILLIEAMKTFNEILAPRAGTVTAILVEDNQPVEYDQPLLVVE
jgi:acetyl-CoA carboxylase biotin carboxyl carrier protein